MSSRRAVLTRPTVTFWDKWQKLRQVSYEDISEYHVAFEQALIDLSCEITDEQVKIEKYKSGFSAGFIKTLEYLHVLLPLKRGGLLGLICSSTVPFSGGYH
jgi:hypothetical protein